MCWLLHHSNYRVQSINACIAFVQVYIGVLEKQKVKKGIIALTPCGFQLLDSLAMKIVVDY